MENATILTNVKIIKRHNAANVIIGILALLSVAIPLVLIFFFQWFAIGINANSGSAEVNFTNGIFQLNAMSLIMGLFQKGGISWHAIIANGNAASALRSNVLAKYLVVENLYAGAIWYLLSALLAVILFIQGLVLLFRGKSNHPNGIVLTAFFALLANGFLLLDSWRLGFYLKYSIDKSIAISGGSISSYQYVFWPNIIIAGSAGLVWLVMLICYLAGLKNKYYREDIEIVHVEQAKPYEVNNGIIRNTLPLGLDSIGGHAFSKNTQLEIATIPNGIEELGQAAFSNCLKLKVVSIPLSVKKIGPNCFFNTPKLKRINYAGSKEQWRYITRGSNWLDKSATTTVLCNNGPISVNPNH